MEQFLQQLDQALTKLNKEERLDIIRDFKEYFANGQAQGKSIEEIKNSLGDVEELAAELLKVYSEEEFVQTANAGNEQEFHCMEIKSEYASVEVLPSKTGEFYTELKNKGDQYRVDSKIVNDTMKVRIQRKGSVLKLFGLQINLQLHTGVVAYVYVPEKLYQSIVVQNDVGAIRMEGLQAKELKCRTSVGGVQLTDLLASKLTAKSNVGKLHLQSIHATTATLKSEAGKVLIEESTAEQWGITSEVGQINLQNVQGEMDIRTEAGKVTMVAESITMPLQFKTSIGKIEVLTKRTIENATIETKSELGKVSIYGESKKRIVYGNGENRIKLSTDLGRITIDNQS